MCEEDDLCKALIWVFNCLPDNEVQQRQKQDILGHKEQQFSGITAHATPLEACHEGSAVGQPINIHEDDGNHKHWLIWLRLGCIKGVAEV